MKSISLLYFASLLCLSLSAHAALILINFGESAYTGDGANSWQSVALRDNPTDQGFASISNQALLDTAGSLSGIRLSVGSANPASGTTGFNSGAAQSDFENPVTGVSSIHDWFDPASAEQRESFTLGSGNVWTYTLSGFASTDQVRVDFVLGRSDSGDRDVDLDLVSGAPAVSYLSAANTADQVHYVSTATLSGSTSYAFTVTHNNGSFGSGLNALGVNVTAIPEPGTFGLAGLAFLLILGLRRSLFR